VIVQSAIWQAFFDDTLLHAVLVLIAIDIVLGVAAAVKTSDFAFSKVAMFARDDLLGKVVPWFVIYAAAKYAPSVDVLGIDLDAIQKGVWALVVVALVGSLVASLADLGLAIPNPLARGENTG
jgi:hypothetical protein